MFDSRKRYPGRVSIPLDADTVAALEALAKAAGASVASVARECIRRGLDPTREAWRKREARRRRREGAAGPDAAADAGDRSPDASGDLSPTEASA